MNTKNKFQKLKSKNKSQIKIKINSKIKQKINKNLLLFPLLPFCPITFESFGLSDVSLGTGVNDISNRESLDGFVL